MRHGRRWLRLAGVAGVCLTLAWPQTARTEGLPGDDTPTTPLTEMVVTATRTETPVSELGVSATVITAKEIERSGKTSVSDLLRDVAGVSIAQSGSRGGATSLHMRGGDSDSTLVLVDGVKVNQVGGFYDFSTLTTDNVERIEIIRGPQSALYGSDAMTGVINVITKKGAGKPTVTVSTADGGHSESGKYIGEQKASFSAGNDKISGTLAYGRQDDGGIVGVNNAYWSNTASGRLDMRFTDAWNASFTSRYQNSRFGYPSENGGDIADRAFPGLDPQQWQNRSDWVNALTTSVKATPWLDAEATLSHYRLSLSNRDPANPDITAFDAPPGSRSYSSENRTTFDTHANARFPANGDFKSTLTLGYEWQRESCELNSIYTARYGPIPWGVYTSAESTDADRTNNAFYLQDQFTLFERLHLTGGFRVDNNSDFGVEVTPRGSAAFEISEWGGKIRASVGEGIKAPTFLQTLGGYGTYGNPDIDPERVFTWEAGYDQELFSGKATLGVTYFENKYKDLIAFLASTYPLPANPPPNYVNVQKAESSGVELSGKVKAGWGFTLGGSYTHLWSKVTDAGNLGSILFAEGEKLIQRPSDTFSLFADWTGGPWNAHLAGTYVGERDDASYTVAPDAFGYYTYTTERVSNPAYFTLDCQVSHTMKFRDATLKEMKTFIKASNILNEKYEDVYGYSSPRASVLGGVSFTF